DYQPALHQRGALALRLDDPAAAEGWLKRACELGPGNAQAHYQYALCLQRLGKADESRAVQKQLVQIERDQKRLTEIISEDLTRMPANADLMCELGQIYLRIGAVVDGLRWLEAALRLDPRHRPTHEALVAHYRATGQHSRAAKHIEFLPRQKHEP
ncbi:MAG: tetratricopeptide repeat protein, partial [Anaerolineae bacterium]|nr:tetratricopeptide repeat protein [Caldilineales bacterium]MDW8270579.1 tetratricopeptide repeat protein [Anaerolineae bacterium]